MKHLILGTAGHIDHGKTALVKALTGIDTEHLGEEKTLGMAKHTRSFFSPRNQNRTYSVIPLW
jgi:selenocysteine-specific translation elongation factor